jgi:outer membrane protein assembly factor BamB
VYRRRRIATATGIAVAALAGVGGFVLLGGDDDDDRDAGWNAVLVLDTTTNIVSVVDAAGENRETLEVDGEPSRLAGPGRGGYVLIGGSDESSVSALDARTGERRTADAGEGEQVQWLRTSNAPVATIGSAQGGPLRILDAESGDEIDVGEVAGLDDPLILPPTILSTPDGRTVVVTDTTSFQTVLVGFDQEEPVFAPGQVAAVGDAGFVTLQPAGDTAEVEFFDLDGENLGSVVVPRPRGLLLTGADSALVVTADGRVLRAEAGSDEGEEVTALEPAADDEVTVTPMAEAGRLLVHLGTETAVLDADGEEIARVEGGELWSMPSGEPACFATSDGSRVWLYSAETGALLADTAYDGPQLPPGAVPSDGCATEVRGESDDATVLTADGARPVDGIVVDIAPDGTAAIVRQGDELQLIPLDDGDAETIALDGTIATFVSR